MKEIKTDTFKINIGLKSYDEIYENPLRFNDTKYVLLENNKIHIVSKKLNNEELEIIKNALDSCIYIKCNYYQIPKLNKNEFNYELTDKELIIICDFKFYDNIDGERKKYLKKKHNID
jgi:hypothetical protein